MFSLNSKVYSLPSKNMKFANIRKLCHMSDMSAVVLLLRSPQSFHCTQNSIIIHHLFQNTLFLAMLSVSILSGAKSRRIQIQVQKLTGDASLIEVEHDSTCQQV